MERLDDRELSIVGEAYASFSEAYRVNEHRALNTCYGPVGDRSATMRAEVAPGTWFSPEQTKEALLFGYEGFSAAFARSQARMERLMAERYEWRADERADTDVYGANVVVERVAAGHPETFTRPRRHMRKKRSVAIVYDTMCAASTPLEKRVEAACAVMAAARALERVGYEVKLDFALAKFSGNSMAGDATLLLAVGLKGYGEPFVASRMEFPLAAKSVLFHLGCFWAHRFAGTPMDYGPGEGYPLSYDPRRVKAMEAFAKKRGGAYLSEDIVEVQLAADPVRVLERVLGVAGDFETLALHVRRKIAMNVAVNPKQGKLFFGIGGDARPDGRGAPGASGETGDATSYADSAAAGEAGGVSPNAAQPLRAPRPFNAAGQSAAVNAGAGNGEEGTGDDAHESTQGEGGAGFDAQGAGGQIGVSAHADAGDAAARGAGAERGMQPDTGDGGGETVDGEAVDATGSGRGFAASMDGFAEEGGGTPGDAGVSFTRHTDSGQDGAGRDGSVHDGEQADGERADEGTRGEDEDGAEGMGEQGSTAQESLDGQGKKAATTATDGRDEDAGAMAHEQPEPEQSREEQSLERDEDPFVVMLRKRFVRFEEGAYREQSEAERARAEAHRAGRTPPAPPITAENSEGGFKLGAPRNTPFSISYVPKKK